jgi:hypothetical protein
VIEFQDDFVKKLRNKYESLIYKIGRISYIEDLINSGGITRYEHLLSLNNLITEQVNFYDNNAVRFEAYQELIDVFQMHLNRMRVANYNDDALNPTIVTGLISYDKISSVDVSKVLNFNTIIDVNDLIGKLEPSQIEEYYTSQIIDLIKSNQVEFYQSKIIDLITVYLADEIIGKFASSQIDSIYSSQIKNLVNHNQISTITTAQITGYSNPSYIASNIKPYFVSSQLSEDLLASLNTDLGTINLSLFNQATPSGLYVCSGIFDDTYPKQLIFGSTDGIDQVQARINCALYTSVNKVASSSFYYNYDEGEYCCQTAATSPKSAYSDCLGLINGADPSHTIFSETNCNPG